MERGPDVKYRPLPHIVEGAARDRSLAEHGEAFEWNIPVMGISFEDARAWCTWKTKTMGREWRLSMVEERVKVARG